MSIVSFSMVARGEARQGLDTRPDDLTPDMAGNLGPWTAHGAAGGSSRLLCVCAPADVAEITPNVTNNRQDATSRRT